MAGPHHPILQGLPRFLVETATSAVHVPGGRRSLITWTVCAFRCSIVPLPWYLGGNQLEAIHDSYHLLLACAVWCSQVPLVPSLEKVGCKRQEIYFEERLPAKQRIIRQCVRNFGVE